MRESQRQTFQIRNATFQDCEAILECLRSAFPPYQESCTPEAFLNTFLTPGEGRYTTQESFGQRLSGMAIFVATVKSGKVVGTIACKAESVEGHHSRTAVHPAWQGSGVSKYLLERAENELRTAGCKVVIRDTTEPLRKAVRFYETKLSTYRGCQLLLWNIAVGIQQSHVTVLPLEESVRFYNSPI